MDNVKFFIDFLLDRIFDFLIFFFNIFPHSVKISLHSEEMRTPKNTNWKYEEHSFFFFFLEQWQKHEKHHLFVLSKSGFRKHGEHMGTKNTLLSNTFCVFFVLKNRKLFLKTLIKALYFIFISKISNLVPFQLKISAKRAPRPPTSHVLCRKLQPIKVQVNPTSTGRVWFTIFNYFII